MKNTQPNLQGEQQVTIQVGSRAIVSVSAATIWTSSTAPGELDRLALGIPTATRDWVSGMTREQRVTGLVDRTLTQTLLGDEVIVEAIESNWAKVILPDQPSSLDSRGYPGWMPVDQLAVPSADHGNQNYVVSATSTAIRDEPGGDVIVPGVSLGTRLTVIDDSYRGWAKVLLPGPRLPGWVRLHDLSVAPLTEVQEASGRLDVVSAAQQLLDIPYVWGGLTAYGLDCSGLVYLVYRQLGKTLPRDAHDQAAATEQIEFDDVKPGDLYFFAHKGKTIHHIGIATERDDNGDQTMIHAAGNYGKVVAETIPADRLDTLVSASRVFSS